MSKAMEADNALDELIPHDGPLDFSQAFALQTLRDYITTTEAELENARDVIEEFGARVEIGSIGHISAQDAIDGINKVIGPDKKAARIKELEEALKRLCPDGDIGEGLSSGYTLSSESILAARAALAKAEGRP